MADYRDGMVHTGTPLTAGTVSVAQAGEDYTIVIDAYDDAPWSHRITVIWTGKPRLADRMKRADAPARTFKQRQATVQACRMQTGSQTAREPDRSALP